MFHEAQFKWTGLWISNRVVVASFQWVHAICSAPLSFLFSCFEQGSHTESASTFKANNCAKKCSSASEGPMFSRPTNKKFQYTAEDCKYNETAEEAPKFARPHTMTNEAMHFQLKERRNGLESNGKQRWHFTLIGVFWLELMMYCSSDFCYWEVHPFRNVEKFPFVFANAGGEWSPRMDVAESGSMYVVSIELPGVNIGDIKVEVSDKR